MATPSVGQNLRQGLLWALFHHLREVLLPPSRRVMAASTVKIGQRSCGSKKCRVAKNGCRVGEF